MRRLALSIASLLLGIGIGAIILYAGARWLRFDNPVLIRFGIRKPEIIGFLPYWLLDKADKDYRNYLTTLTYFGLAVDTDGKPIYLANPGEEDPGWTALKGDRWETQKKKAGSLKLSLLVHSADEATIGELLVSPNEKAVSLVTEVAPIMKKRGFTDLNLDIESFSEATEGATHAFTQYVKAVVREAKDNGIETVTVEIPPIALFRNNIADPVALGSIADRIVLMTYDYHYSGSLLTGPVAPVGGAGTVREFDVTMAVTEAVRQIPKEKIILGIPLYGYEWETLQKTPSAATIPGSAQTASSRRIAELLSMCASCSASIDGLSKEPYIVYDDGGHFQQLHYENEASMNEKIALAKSFDLAGVALWALGYEDGTILSPLTAYKDEIDWDPRR